MSRKWFIFMAVVNLFMAMLVTVITQDNPVLLNVLLAGVFFVSSHLADED